MFIENRIKKTETKQIVVYWERFFERKVFPMKSGKLQQAKGAVMLRRKNSVNNWLHNPNNYLRSSSNVASLFKENTSEAVQAKKSIRWMPWHREPMKDATTCDKLRLVGNKRLTRRFPNGETPMVKNHGSVHESIVYRGEPAELKHLSRRRKRNQTRFRK